MVDLLLQICCIPRLGHGSNRKVCRGRLGDGANPRSSDLHFEDFEPLPEVQCLCHTTDTRAAMHAFDSKREFRQFGPPPLFDDTPGLQSQRRCRLYGTITIG